MTLADVEFDVRGDLEERDDVIRCLRNLILTPAGTVPLERDFGIDNSFLGEPTDVVQSMLAVEIIMKVMKYEPRATVAEISIEPGETGQIFVKVVITSA